MGSVNSIPIVTQVKSFVQVVSGDSEGARQTQEDFIHTGIIASQITSAVQAIQGDTQGAKETQEKFVKNLGDFVDGIPVVGHIKGAIEYAVSDKEAGQKSMESASRSVAVWAGAVGGFFVGGAAGAVAAAIATGAVADGIITGVESAVNHKYTPYGEVATVTNMIHGHFDPGEEFDLVAGIGFDALAGLTEGMEGAISKTAKVDRVYMVTTEELAKKAVDKQELPRGYQASQTHDTFLRAQEQIKKGADQEIAHIEKDTTRTDAEKQTAIDKINVKTQQKILKAKKRNKGETWFTENAVLHSRTYIDTGEFRTHTIQIDVDSTWYQHMRKKALDQKGSGKINELRLQKGKKLLNVFNDERLARNIGIKNANLGEFNQYINRVKQINVKSWKYSTEKTLYIAEKGAYVGAIVTIWSTNVHNNDEKQITSKQSTWENSTEDIRLSTKAVHLVAYGNDEKRMTSNRYTSENSTQHFDGSKNSIYLIGDKNDQIEALFKDEIPTGLLEIKKILITFKWKDQGSGDQKGRIYLRILKHNPNEKFIDIPLTDNVSPHDWQNVQYESDTIGYKYFDMGDSIQFMRFIGNSSEYELFIENFQADITYGESQYRFDGDTCIFTPKKNIELSADMLDEIKPLFNQIIPCSTKALKQISIIFHWKDQGFENQKGKIYLRIWKNHKKEFKDIQITNELSPHDWEYVSFYSDTIGYNDIDFGDKLQFMRYVGEGGFHQLFIKNFQAKILFGKSQYRFDNTTCIYSPIKNLHLTEATYNI